MESPPVIEPLKNRLLRAVPEGLAVIEQDTGAVSAILPVAAEIRSLAVSADQSLIVAGDAAGHLRWFHDVPSGLEQAGEISIQPGANLIRAFISADGRRVCVIDDQWRLTVVDWPARTIRMTLENAPVAVPHPDGQHLMRTFANNDDIQVLRLSDSGVAATLKGHQSTISRIAFTADGQTCISTSHDRTICLWDVRTWTLRQQLTGHESPVLALAISPRGDLAVTGDNGGTLRLWDVKSGRELTELDERITPMVDLRFDASGTALIGWDTALRVHRIPLR